MGSPYLGILLNLYTVEMIYAHPPELEPEKSPFELESMVGGRSVLLNPPQSHFVKKGLRSREGGLGCSNSQSWTQGPLHEDTKAQDSGPTLAARTPNPRDWLRFVKPLNAKPLNDKPLNHKPLNL